MNSGKEVVNIKISNIIPNRFQPRITFDEEALNELTNSIKMHGILQPLIVRQVGDKYEIIAGERRYKAATRAGLNEVPAIVVNFDDQTSAELALIENIQRKDLTPLEEAKSYKKLLDMSNITQEQLALKLGKKQSTIANKIRLLNLSPDVQDALMNNAISERHARSLLQIKNNDEKQKEVLKRIIEERLTVKETDELIKRLLNIEPTLNNTETVSTNNVNTSNNGLGMQFNSTNTLGANNTNTLNSPHTLGNSSNWGVSNNDVININDLSSPNMIAPTVPIQPYSNITSNYEEKSDNDMIDLTANNQPAQQQTKFPDYDSLLKPEEPTIPIEENKPVEKVIVPTIGKFPTEREINYTSLEDQSANFSFDKPFTTPKTSSNVVPIDPNHITDSDRMNFINFNNPSTDVKSTQLNSATTPLQPPLQAVSTPSFTVPNNASNVNAPINNTYSTTTKVDLSSSISRTKDFVEELKKSGVNIIVEELDMTDEYRIVLRIKKTS